MAQPLEVGRRRSASSDFTADDAYGCRVVVFSGQKGGGRTCSPAVSRPIRIVGLIISMIGVLLAGAVGGTGGAAASVGSTANAVALSKIVWKPCRNASGECATVTVPLDPTQPTRRQIGVAVVRFKATQKNGRLGVLMVNPGGPGASAVTFARNFAQASTTENIRERYDIVGFDPRGVGDTIPLQCNSRKELEKFYSVDGSPDDAVEVEQAVAAARGLSDACKRTSSEVLPFLGTDYVVGDMDLVRAALGEETISFFGFSYGTYLGAKYADRFPHRVERFVLDGVLDPTASLDDRTRLQALGFEDVLNRFFADCKSSTCTFARKGESPGAAYDRLLGGLEKKRIAVGRGEDQRSLGPGEAETAVIASLYNQRTGWPSLREGLNELNQGKGDVLLSQFDRYADRDPDGSFRNTLEANSATNCTDLPSAHDASHFVDLAAELTRVAPRLGSYAAFSAMICAVWPAGPNSTGSGQRPITAKGAKPILVVGTRSDPATPYVWAESLVEQLDSAKFLTWNGVGHTAFFGGSSCVTKRVTEFFLSGKAEKSMVCS